MNPEPGAKSKRRKYNLISEEWGEKKEQTEQSLDKRTFLEQTVTLSGNSRLKQIAIPVMSEAEIFAQYIVKVCRERAWLSFLENDGVRSRARERVINEMEDTVEYADIGDAVPDEDEEDDNVKGMRLLMCGNFGA